MKINGEDIQVDILSQDRSNINFFRRIVNIYLSMDRNKPQHPDASFWPLLGYEYWVGMGPKGRLYSVHLLFPSVENDLGNFDDLDGENWMEFARVCIRIIPSLLLAGELKFQPLCGLQKEHFILDSDNNPHLFPHLNLGHISDTIPIGNIKDLKVWLGMSFGLLICKIIDSEFFSKYVHPADKLVYAETRFSEMNLSPHISNISAIALDLIAMRISLGGAADRFKQILRLE